MIAYGLAYVCSWYPVGSLRRKSAIARGRYSAGAPARQRSGATGLERVGRLDVGGKARLGPAVDGVQPGVQPPEVRAAGVGRGVLPRVVHEPLEPELRAVGGELGE